MSILLLQLMLSHEHQGFVFEPNTMKAVNMLLLHSGGKVSKALEMAVSNGAIDDLDDGSKIIGKPIETVGVDSEQSEKKGFCMKKLVRISDLPWKGIPKIILLLLYTYI